MIQRSKITDCYIASARLDFLQDNENCHIFSVADASQNYNFCISNILTKYKQATTHRKQRQTVSMDYRSCNQEVRRITQCKTESQSLEMNHTQQDTHCKRSYKTSENMQNIKYIPWEARKSTPMEIVYNALNKVFHLVK